MAATAFVSGASGFIAQHIVKQLLEKEYKVVGSVRSEAKGENLKKNFGANFSYEIVEDLETVGAFDKALKKHPEVTVFLHTASPATLEVEDVDREMILPAINGTINVLKAIKSSAPQVEKVVITSSIVTTLNFSDFTATASEDTWNTLSHEQAVKVGGQAAYAYSKTQAEKAAIEFMKNEDPHFTVSTVHPVLTLGPQAFDLGAKGGVNATNQMLSDLLKLKAGEVDDVPTANFPFVDVRDVAASQLNGLRVIPFSDRFTSQKALNIINEHFPELNLIKGSPTENLSGGTPVNSEKSREYLGLTYISLEKTVVDTIKQFIEVNK